MVGRWEGWEGWEGVLSLISADFSLGQKPSQPYPTFSRRCNLLIMRYAEVRRCGKVWEGRKQIHVPTKRKRAAASACSGKRQALLNGYMRSSGRLTPAN